MDEQKEQQIHISPNSKQMSTDHGAANSSESEPKYS
jgi:hypothetical protein